MYLSEPIVLGATKNTLVPFLLSLQTSTMPVMTCRCLIIGHSIPQSPSVTPKSGSPVALTRRKGKEKDLERMITPESSSPSALITIRGRALHDRPTNPAYVSYARHLSLPQAKTPATQIVYDDEQEQEADATSTREPTVVVPRTTLLAEAHLAMGDMPTSATTTSAL
ncbi:hypothetical protein T440DRAFT_479302 [Plenodomus tracheiphilus IPT5]|uniref:Uncharacterized protein n=1 Tax=Plenodomus tracheiphilus IPT5 TaxID=1408161 RepID=A0A6A7B7D5_9PLEO|nr:hypothetical protein T440DRAFT_479302 [Plenodomus tracheiphilus IPT5]